MMSMLQSNQRNSMGFYSSFVVDVCEIAFFPSLQTAGQLVAESPNYNKQLQEDVTTWKHLPEHVTQHDLGVATGDKRA